MIISGVAERVPERLAGLVYLDALVPADGEDSYDAELSSEDVRVADRAAADAAGMPGFLLVDLYVEWLGSLMPDAADREWLLATYTQPIRLGHPAAVAVPRIFVLCTEGKEAGDTFTSIATRVRSAPGWRYLELSDNHLAPINGPAGDLNRSLVVAFLWDRARLCVFCY